MRAERLLFRESVEKSARYAELSSRRKHFIVQRYYRSGFQSGNALCNLSTNAKQINNAQSIAYLKRFFNFGK